MKSLRSFSAALVFAAAGAALPAQAGTLNVLHQFTGGADGAGPYLWVVLDRQGDLFGVTTDGGTDCVTSAVRYSEGCGVLWKIDAQGTFSVLVTFTGAAAAGPGTAPGAVPKRLTLAGRYLYGATTGGGATDNGVIFRVRTDGGDFKILHDFQGADGCNPGRPNLDSAGNVYAGVACGANGNGAIVKIATGGKMFTTLRSWPAGTVSLAITTIVDPESGKIYGTTFDSSCSGVQSPGCGTLFSLSLDGATFSQLLDFSTTQAGSSNVLGTLRNNVLYGVSERGGANNLGAVWKYTLAANMFTIQHALQPGSDGSGINPDSDGPAGLFYGTTFYGGTSGTIWSVTTGHTYQVVHTFASSGAEGGYSYGIPAWDNTRKILYGTNNLLGTGSTKGCSRPDGSQNNPYGCGTIWSYTP